MVLMNLSSPPLMITRFQSPHLTESAWHEESDCYLIILSKLIVTIVNHYSCFNNHL